MEITNSAHADEGSPRRSRNARLPWGFTSSACFRASKPVTSPPQDCGRASWQLPSVNWNGSQNCQFIRWSCHRNNQRRFSDSRLGIKRDRYYCGWLIQDGEHQEYVVPGDFRHYTESEIKGYRAAFSAIANEFESLTGLKKQLDEVCPHLHLKGNLHSTAWHLAGAFNAAESGPERHFALPEAKRIRGD